MKGSIFSFSGLSMLSLNQRCGNSAEFERAGFETLFILKFLIREKQGRVFHKRLNCQNSYCKPFSKIDRFAIYSD